MTNPSLPAFPPPDGYSVPTPAGVPQNFDPLISPDYAGWWGRATALVKRGWRTLALVQGVGAVLSFVVQAPVGVYAAFVTRDLSEELTKSGDSGEVPDLTGLFKVAGISLSVNVLQSLISAAVTIAAIYVCVSVAVSRPPAVGPALGIAARRAFPVIGWSVIGGLLVVVGVFACLLPAFYVYAVIVILPAVVIFERTNAVGRCFRLFHADLGAAAARAATIVGLAIGAASVAGVLSMIVNAAASSLIDGDAAIVVGSVISTGLGVLAAAAVAILAAPLILTAYADLRARYEPLTTEVLATELAIPVA